jgi:ubiquinone/menaquinone biosynthesis C-methylase UbiE
MNRPNPAQPAQDGLFSGISFPEMYEDALVGPVFDPWVEPLFRDVGLAPGDCVLDVACGTGIVARRAKERLGETATVVGVDANAQMLTVARRVTPSIDWREGDAGALPLRDGEAFDVALCQQGFQFFPDRAAAARQMRRALTEGGRLGVSTWRPDEEFPVLLQLRKVAEEHVGPIADRRHSLGDPGPLEAVLEQTGFRDIRSKRSSRTIRFDDGMAFVHLNAMALVGMSASSRSLSDEDRQAAIAAIVRDSAEAIREYMDGDALAYEIGTNVVLARAS